MTYVDIALRHDIDIKNPIFKMEMHLTNNLLNVNGHWIDQFTSLDLCTKLVSLALLHLHGY